MNDLHKLFLAVRSLTPPEPNSGSQTAQNQMMDLTRLREIWNLFEEASEKETRGRECLRALIHDEEDRRYRQLLDQKEEEKE